MTLETDSPVSGDNIRQTVRAVYDLAAQGEGASCSPGCCDGSAPQASLALGYSPQELAAVPEGANLGLGCGNPQAIATLKPAETVVDLGSGAGFDCFLAARQVGENGQVIGVDMTPSMITKARSNAAKVETKNVEFRLGEIEHLPIADDTADVILSNCVINLSPEKTKVYQEAFRVLKAGGRLAISDVVVLKPLPPSLREDAAALSGCVAGAVTVGETETALRAAGFGNVQVTVKPESRAFIEGWLPGSGVENYVASATIQANKPGPEGSCCEPTCCA